MEQELKLGLVHPEDLPRLLDTLPEPHAQILQENHYLSDPEGRTREAGIMVRLRVETVEGSSRALLTLKRRLKAQGGVVLSWEKEEDFPLEPARRVAAGLMDAMEVQQAGVAWLAKALGVTSLRHEGTLKNHRTVILAEGFTLEVDESHFPDGSVDAEVEVETEDPEGARSLVRALAAGAKVALFEQERGKYTRYLQRRGCP